MIGILVVPEEEELVFLIATLRLDDLAGGDCLCLKFTFRSNDLTGI